MQVYKRELKRLKSAKAILMSGFPRFGVNKKQEITRLLYEISKREAVSPNEIIKKENLRDYEQLKKYLLRRRYPESFSFDESFQPFLPKIELKAAERAGLKKREFLPKKIILEKKESFSVLTKRFKELFPQADFCEINSLKEYRCSVRRTGIEDYNRRQDTVFIVSEGYDFFKNCPCTKGALSCGYQIFNLGFGCVFECVYCFLQEYANSPGIILPANISRFFDQFNVYKKRGMRIGTGEFSDSLALDKVTQYSLPIIEFFRKQKGVTFEFKTKSIEIENILKTRHAGNIVVSWSLNPQSIIDDCEYFTPSLEERLAAAAKCVEAGYGVGFHFDPVVYSSDWQDKYSSLIERMFSRIRPKHIAWISIGTFRFSPGLKQIIERRFPGNKILNEELLLGFDRKLRYPYAVRYGVYKKMLEMLSGHSRELKIYLCMEEASIWKDLKMKLPRF